MLSPLSEAEEKPHSQTNSDKVVSRGRLVGGDPVLSFFTWGNGQGWRPAGIHNNFVLELTLLGEPGGLPGDRLIGGGSVPESLAASFNTAAAAVAACLFGELVLMFVVLVVVPFWLLLLVRLLCRPAVLGTPPPLPTTLSLSSCCCCCFC